MTEAKVIEGPGTPITVQVMNPPSNGELIHGKMIAVMRELGAIGKDRQCTSGATFAYRGIDQVYNAINPLLSKHGVFMGSRILRKERTERAKANGGALAFTTLHIRYRFVAEDGSYCETDAEGEGMDSGDKSSNKAMAVAHKYALLQAFCIPTEDMPDPDSEVHEVAASGLTDAQKAELAKWIKDSGANIDQFCEHWKIEAVPDLAPKNFGTAIAMLKERKKREDAKKAPAATTTTTTKEGTKS